MRASRLMVVCLVVVVGGAERSLAWLTLAAEGSGFPQGSAAVLFEPGGDVISGGTLGNDQVVIRRHAAGDGAELWRFAVSGITSTRDGVDFAHDGAGDLLAALHRRLSDGSQLGTIVKLDPTTGAERWRREIPGARFYGVAVDAVGDAVAVGILGIQHLAHETLVVKVSGEDGSELWRVQMPGSFPHHNILDLVEASPDGDFFVAGSLAKPRPGRNPGDEGFSVLRLRSSDGQQVWWQEMGSYGSVEEIAVDPNGDLVAVGVDFQTTFLAVKLRGSNGDLLWNVPTPRVLDERATAVAVDPAGDVFIAGSMTDPAWPSSISTTSVTTLKIAGSNGAILWRHDVSNTRSGGANCCRDRDIAVGPDGHPVTIGMLGTYTEYRPVVVKLFSATGEKLWKTEPSTGAPASAQVSIGSDGSVAIASSRHNDCTNGCGYYTVAKLRGRSGLGYFAGCGDELDNDGDGAIDDLEDAGCADASSPVEDPACQNGLDDDDDGRIDHPEDLGCASTSASTENPACQDGVDNDGDGRVDYPGDLGCASPSAATESPACQDGADNDGDGHVDYPHDAGCAIPSSATESPACQDGVDNDGDMWADHPTDPGCASPSSATESPACQDGWDNDGDGTIDFDGGASVIFWAPPTAPDPDCPVAHHNNEAARPSGCGLGGELAIVGAFLTRLRRRARRSFAS